MVISDYLSGNKLDGEHDHYAGGRDSIQATRSSKRHPLARSDSLTFAGNLPSRVSSWRRVRDIPVNCLHSGSRTIRSMTLSCMMFPVPSMLGDRVRHRTAPETFCDLLSGFFSRSAATGFFWVNLGPTPLH